jgi:outer membrane biogenesis lipoprotein LolB
MTVVIAIVALLLLGGCTSTVNQKETPTELDTQNNHDEKQDSNDTGRAYSVQLEKPPFLDDER